VIREAANSGARRFDENRNSSTLLLKICIERRNRVTGLLSHPAIRVAADAPRMNPRRLRTLATFATRNHVEQFPWMQRDQHQMHRDEERERHSTPRWIARAASYPTKSAVKSWNFTGL
jgi:hypothetical protein